MDANIPQNPGVDIVHQRKGHSSDKTENASGEVNRRLSPHEQWRSSPLAQTVAGQQRGSSDEQLAISMQMS